MMPDITLPEVKLPDIRLPEGLRDMTRDDIAHAARDVRMPKVELPRKIELPDIDLSNVDLPKPIADRLPRRKQRPNPLLPLAGLIAIGAAVATIWWLFTSAETGPRMRSAVNGVHARLTGRRNDLIRYDDDSDLGSLLADERRPAERTLDYDSATALAPAGTIDTAR